MKFRSRRVHALILPMLLAAQMILTSLAHASSKPRATPPLSFSKIGLTWSTEAGHHQFTLPAQSFDQEGTHWLSSSDSEGVRLEVRKRGPLLALRFHIQSPTAVTIVDEQLEFKLAPLQSVRGASKACPLDSVTDCFHDSHEGDVVAALSQDPTRLTFLPILAQTGGSAYYIGETNARNYPGAYLQNVNTEGTFKFVSPRAPRTTRITPDAAFEEVLERHSHLVTYPAGEHDLPWRFFYHIDHPAQLLAGNLLNELVDPSEPEDDSWIQPGFGTEEWITGAHIDLPESVLGFKPGVNTETYKFYIDFAHDYGLQYVILDDGWYLNGDMAQRNPQVDLSLLKDYAKSRGVKLILWVQFTALLDNMEAKLDELKQLGAAVLKIDFFNRDDIGMIQFQEKLFRETRKRQLMLIMHGVAKPAGQDVTYPHIMGWEAGKGHEYSKWTSSVTLQHRMNMLLLRNPLGVFDFEGAGFRNLKPSEFVVDVGNPFSQGTRTSEIAFYALLSTKIHILAGNLGDYIRSPEQTRFLTSLPPVWDEVVPLSVQLDDHIAIAKRSKRDWYVAAINGRETPFVGTAQLQIPTEKFLQPGRYAVTVLTDCQDPSTPATCAELNSLDVEITAHSRWSLPMAAYGGYLARFVRK